MILSDASILERLRDGSLAIDPLDDLELQVQPASVDLRLGEIVTVPHHVERARHYPGGLWTGYLADDEPWDGWRLHSHAFTIACTLERVRIPPDLVGVVDGRSTYGRLGLAVHVTAGYIDPGFEGQITLELVNHSHEHIHLKRGDRIAQLRLHTMTQPSARPYGHPSRGSKYQGQLGATPSRVSLDR